MLANAVCWRYVILFDSKDSRWLVEFKQCHALCQYYNTFNVVGMRQIKYIFGRRSNRTNTWALKSVLKQFKV